MKKYLTIILTLIICFIMNLTVFAKTNVISFSDSNEGIDISNTNLFNGFSNWMPGDVFSENINFVNNCNKEITYSFWIENSFNEYAINSLQAINLEILANSNLIYNDTLSKANNDNKVKIVTLKPNESKTISFNIKIPYSISNKYITNNTLINWCFDVLITEDTYNNSTSINGYYSTKRSNNRFETTNKNNSSILIEKNNNINTNPLIIKIPSIPDTGENVNSSLVYLILCSLLFLFAFFIYQKYHKPSC